METEGKRKQMRKSKSFPSIPMPPNQIQNCLSLARSTEHEQVEVDIEGDPIPPSSIAADGSPSHATAAQSFNSTGTKSQKTDVAERDTLHRWFRNSILYRAALGGDWGKVEILSKQNNVWGNFSVSDSITQDHENMLHVAAGSKHSGFVEKLLKEMSSDQMTMKNKHGNTALCFAATSGAVRNAELIVEKSSVLPLLHGFENKTPLFMAISCKRREMASYLLSVTGVNQLNPQEQLELLIASIHSNFFDISLKLFGQNKKLAILEDVNNNNELALHVLARKSSAIGGRNILNTGKKCINHCFKGIYSEDMMKKFARKLVKRLLVSVQLAFPQNENKFIKLYSRLLNDAAKAGNVEFLILLIESCPDIVWEADDDGKTIFHIVVENRLENAFNLIRYISGARDFSTKYKTLKGNYNILHLAAKQAAPNHLNKVSGAALQMQRELLWFKEVEKIVLPSQLEAKCDTDDVSIKLTPRELFTKEHMDLRRKGEEWMKNTANSCMLVATLIATVVFAAAFTVPGGGDNNKGAPIYRQELWFTVFVMSDAAGLITSSSSILMFLSMLTSRYAEDDFLHSLPLRLLFGLAMLFISIVCMVVAFTATFFLLYHEDNIRVPIIVAAMAIVPVGCCALQFKLWIDTFNNTFLARFIFTPRQQKFTLDAIIRNNFMLHWKNKWLNHI